MGYYLSLRQAQVTVRQHHPNWEPWLSYFLRVLSRQVTRLEDRLNALDTIVRDDEPVPDRVLHVLTLAGSASVGTLAEQLDVNRNTLKKHLAALADAGRIVRIGAGRGTRYLLPR